MGEVFRDARPKNELDAVIDGLPNIYYHTASGAERMVPLESGINAMRAVGSRRPAILITSSPHKIGSVQTPWQDHFNSDEGHVRYFGDNKDPETDPSASPGNRTLLLQFDLHRGALKSDRLSAAPILLFQRVAVGGRQKGNLKFHGVALLAKVERVNQYDRSRTRTFTNYAYDFAIMNLRTENDVFPWEWVNARRDPSLSDEDTLKYAPESWRRWVQVGDISIDRLRHRVAKLNLVPREDQLPVPKSKEESLLRQVYEFYSGRKHRFESLAAKVTEHVIRESGADYTFGWITPQGGDFGIDFVGKLSVGRGFGSASLIVLGQAKCEKSDVPTGGNHIARTVARLRRGWIGAYVTTSYFSARVQREAIEDRFPIILINGRTVSEAVSTMHHEQGTASVSQFLEKIDAEYEDSVASRSPEELLQT